MIFNSDKPIFLQMADRLCDEILADKYKDDDRIPSVREYAVLLEDLNPSPRHQVSQHYPFLHHEMTLLPI